MRNQKTAVLTATTVLLGVFLVGCGSTTQYPKVEPCAPGKVRDVYSKSPTYRQCVDAVKKHGL